MQHCCMDNVQIRQTTSGDGEWIKSLLNKQWGSTRIVTRGKILNAVDLPGFIANDNGEKVGLITYSLRDNECEIVTLDSLVEGKGFGTKLIEEVVKIADETGCSRVWLITTNDNMKALHFYQKNGFTLSALYPNALVESRKLKPEIPETGIDGLPLRDEIELEMKL